jgi:hypothetical protein
MPQIFKNQTIIEVYQNMRVEHGLAKIQNLMAELQIIDSFQQDK